MKIEDIYKWLFEHDPRENTEVRLAWANLASYCYFINLMDFDARYRDKLIQVLNKSQEYGISVPDSNHQQVIELAESMKIGSFGSAVKN